MKTQLPPKVLTSQSVTQFVNVPPAQDDSQFPDVVFALRWMSEL
jgi:hypothetical protein